MLRRFFYDTEFIEYPNTIDIISIGIVDEQGNEFYGINYECDFSKACNWVVKNVLIHLPQRPIILSSVAGIPTSWPDKPWMTRSQLSQGVFNFLRPTLIDPVDMWAWCGAFDHVVLCWLFGNMDGLPKGMPHYTKDLKQFHDYLGCPPLPKQTGTKHNALDDAKWNKELWESLTFKERTG